MICIKSNKELEKMRKAGLITAGALKAAGEALRPGMTTHELDKVVEKYILSHGAKPGFKGYGGFPAAACISVNDEVIHGIPGSRKILEGDIVSVDTGAFVDGYHGDSCKTFACGKISDDVQALLDSTEQSLYEAIKMVKPGVRIGDIGAAIQKYNEDRGFSVVREYCGHGLGRDLHEDPEVPNYGKAGHGVRLQAGMVICIEPMINMGGAGIKVLPDGWTVKTLDGKWSAHFEHTIAVTQDGCVILSRL
ncbi:MAG: type I methionyl aminopeptidase [Ruminococcus sp.]|nr:MULTISPECIES: type I methionyl aminopeptidase [Ruminococcus]MBO4866896.1 type I methionyl aminopeptidase [Ruminococcus sp.]